jgi:NAD(P)-dependent dehydrogenase (short-subunit alcohol dehydrogenase family)
MKVALITGANKGIGFEVAKQLGKQGVKILLGARSPEKGEQAASTLKALGIDVAHVLIDITNEQSVSNAAKKIENEYGKLDILINNAGVFPEFQKGIFDITALPYEDLLSTFQTNVFGAIYTTKHFFPLLKKAEYANIVNVSSTAGSITNQSDKSSPFYNMITVAYASSKAALNMVTVQTAKQTVGTNIKVNSICPGWVKTDMGSEAAPKTVEQGALIILKMATLGKEDTTNGVFIDDEGIILW